jgi:hypothetical protein
MVMKPKKLAYEAPITTSIYIVMLYPLLELHFRGGLMTEQDSSRFMENQPSLFFLWLRTICPKCWMLINFIKSMITFLWLFCSPMFELKMTPIGNM